jgi:hypothetical protein
VASQPPLVAAEEPLPIVASLPPFGDADPAVVAPAAVPPVVRRITPAPPQPVSGPSPFEKLRYRFATGVPAGEIVRITDDDGKALFNYRSFAGVVGIVAALVSGIIAAAGLAATAFLLIESHPLAALGALVLSFAFAVAVPMLVPPLSVTLFDDARPMLTITQRSRFNIPSVLFAVVTPDGHLLGYLRKSFLSRIGRNQWTLLDDRHHPIGRAIEESLSQALLRKMAGKFSRRYEANVRLRAYDREAGWILRRPDAHNAVDVLDVNADSNRILDRRISLALAMLVLGMEP